MLLQFSRDGSSMLNATISIKQVRVDVVVTRSISSSSAWLTVIHPPLHTSKLHLQAVSFAFRSQYTLPSLSIIGLKLMNVATEALVAFHDVLMAVNLSASMPDALLVLEAVALERSTLQTSSVSLISSSVPLYFMSCYVLYRLTNSTVSDAFDVSSSSSSSFAAAAVASQPPLTANLVWLSFDRIERSVIRLQAPTITLRSQGVDNFTAALNRTFFAVLGCRTRFSFDTSCQIQSSAVAMILLQSWFGSEVVAVSAFYLKGLWSNSTAEVYRSTTPQPTTGCSPLASLFLCETLCTIEGNASMLVSNLALSSVVMSLLVRRVFTRIILHNTSFTLSRVVIVGGTLSRFTTPRYAFIGNSITFVRTAVTCLYALVDASFAALFPPSSASVLVPQLASYQLVNATYTAVLFASFCSRIALTDANESNSPLNARAVTNPQLPQSNVTVNLTNGSCEIVLMLTTFSCPSRRTASLEPSSFADVFSASFSESDISFRASRSTSCAFDTSSTFSASSSRNRQTPSANATGTVSIVHATHTHTVSPRSSISILLSRSVNVCPKPTLREISSVTLASFSGSSGGLFHVVLAMSAPFADTAVSWGSTWALLAPVPVANWTRINASAVAVTLHLLVDPHQAVVLTVAQPLTLTATLRVAACTQPGDTAPTLNYTVAASTTITLAPIAALPAVVTAVLEATTAVAGIAGGLLVGGSSAVSLQQSMLLLDLSVCQFSLSASMSVADSPTQLCFGVRLNSCVRGAVIGNVAVCAAFVVALLLLGWWLEGTWRTTLKAVRSNVALPGMLILPYLLLLQPTAAESITLLRHRQDESDVWIGAFGVVVCLLVFLFFPLRVLPYFAHAAVPVDLSSKSRIMQWIAPQYEWVPIHTESDYITLSAQRVDGNALRPSQPADADHGEKLATFTSSYIVLFDAYSPGRHWFFVVEMLNAGINGIIGGIKPISDVGCQGLAYGMLAVTLVGVLLAVLKPYNSRIGTVSYVVQSASGALCSLLVVLQDEGASEAMALVAFISSIAFAAVGMWAKGKTEVRRIVALIKQRWNRFVPAAFLISNIDEPAVEGNEIGAVQELPCASESSFSDISAPVATSRCRRARRNSFAANCELSELLQSVQAETNGCMSFVSQRRMLVFLVTEASRMRAVAVREQEL